MQTGQQAALVQSLQAAEGRRCTVTCLAMLAKLAEQPAMYGGKPCSNPLQQLLGVAIRGEGGLKLSSFGVGFSEPEERVRGARVGDEPQALLIRRVRRTKFGLHQVLSAPGQRGVDLGLARAFCQGPGSPRSVRDTALATERFCTQVDAESPAFRAERCAPAATPVLS